MKYDFLALLLQELHAIGADYEVAAHQQEFDAELPVDLDASDATGRLLRCGARRSAHHARRDPAQTDSKVEVSQPAGGHYTTLYTPRVATYFSFRLFAAGLSVEAALAARTRTSGSSVSSTHISRHSAPTRSARLRRRSSSRLADRSTPMSRSSSSGISTRALRPGTTSTGPINSPTGAARFRDDGERRCPELLLFELVRSDPGLRPHGRSRAHQAGAEDPAAHT